MRKLGISVLVFLGACSTTRITYEVSDEPSKEVVETKAPEPSYPYNTVPDREPDVRSVPATVTFDYPERVNPALYEVTQEVNVRDYPGMEGNWSLLQRMLKQHIKPMSPSVCPRRFTLQFLMSKENGQVVTKNIHYGGLIKPVQQIGMT